MVYVDISNNSDQSQETQKHKTAAVSDRLLAFLLDAFLFFPIFSLISAGMLRELKTITMIGINGEELFLMWSLVAIAAVVLSVVFFGLCIHYFQATPGQKFLQLRVVNLDSPDERVGVGQSLVRCFLWWASLLAMGIPFLEVLSHPLRRAFHERATDTMVVTLKKADDGPHPLETRFIHSWVRTFALMFCFVFGIVFLRTYQAIRTGYFSKLSGAELVCEEVPKQIQDEQKRIDTAIGLYLSGLVSGDCVEQEARLVLWSNSVKSKAMAYLGMSLVNPDETLSDEYQSKVCEEADSEACGIVQYLDSEEKNRADILRKKGLASVTSRLMLLEQMSQERKVTSAMALIEDLKKEKVFDLYLNKQAVRNIWGLNERLKANKGRSPASSEESELLEDFKKEFELP